MCTLLFLTPTFTAKHGRILCVKKDEKIASRIVISQNEDDARVSKKYYKK
jgi:hypothetical protein